MAKQASTKPRPLPKRLAVAERNQWGFPDWVELPGRNGGVCYFEGCAPITGDGLYKGTDKDNKDRHAIVTHPRAKENQKRFLGR